jgi:hypothetical protein
VPPVAIDEMELAQAVDGLLRAIGVAAPGVSQRRDGIDRLDGSRRAQAVSEQARQSSIARSVSPSPISCGRSRYARS